MDGVELERRGDIALVTLRCGTPDNTLNAATWDALRRTALALSDAPPRVAVLYGDPCFSAGLDLSEQNPIRQRLEALSRGRDTYKITEYVSGLRSALTSFGRLPCPVVAAVEGACLGPGFELALTCDLRIVASDARLGVPEVRYGLLPMNGGIVTLQRILGPTRAAELILTGREISPETALTWGLVNRVVEPGASLPAALLLAEEIAGHSRQAVLQGLLALRHLAGSTRSADYEVESQAVARAVAYGDLNEGIAAFVSPSPEEG